MRRPHVVSAFLQLDDPYSYLLAFYLPSLAKYYDIELRVYLSEARGGAYKPEPEMLAILIYIRTIKYRSAIARINVM